LQSFWSAHINWIINIQKFNRLFNIFGNRSKSNAQGEAGAPSDGSAAVDDENPQVKTTNTDLQTHWGIPVTNI